MDACDEQKEISMRTWSFVGKGCIFSTIFVCIISLFDYCVRLKTIELINFRMITLNGDLTLLLKIHYVIHFQPQLIVYQTVSSNCHSCSSKHSSFQA